MAIATVSETAILALVFQAVAWTNYADNAAGTPQTNIAVALHLADPGTAGTQATNEATYGGYARVNVARTTGGWSVGGGGPSAINPVAPINFPAGISGSGTVSFFSTGKTGGGATAILWSGIVTPNIVTGSGVTPSLSTATSITLN